MASASTSPSPLGKRIDICKDEKRRAKERAAKLRLLLLLQLNYIREETVVVVVAVYCSGRRIEFGVPCSSFSSSSMIAADAAFHCLRGQRQQQQQQSKLDGWMHCSCSQSTCLSTRTRRHHCNHIVSSLRCRLRLRPLLLCTEPHQCTPEPRSPVRDHIF